MGSYITNPLEFLFTTLVDLYIFAIILRFLLQAVRADFYNPLSQFIVKVTNPVCQPLRRVLPPVAGQDSASLLMALVIGFAKVFLLVQLKGGSVGIGGLLIWTLADMIGLVLDLFFFAIIARAIISWIHTGAHNPGIALLVQLTDPLMRPVQRILPPIAGIDLSPIAVLIGIQLLKMLILPPLMSLVL